MVVDFTMNQIMKRFKILKIEFVQFHHIMNLQFSSGGLNTIYVHVTDAILCCLLSQNIKCRIDNVDYNCPKLVNETFKLCFHCLVAGATVSSLMSLVVHFTMYNRTSKNLAKNYIMTITNKLFADVICSIYLFFLAVADVINVDTIQFRKGLFCMLINGFSFIAFQGCMMFKTYHVIDVVLKTIFPFKHQCRWLRLTVIKSPSPWITLMTLYIVIMSFRLHKDRVFLDQVCSFADCHTYTRYKDDILLTMATIINIACLAAVLFSVISFILSIKRNSTILNRANKNNERTRLKMVVTLCSPICADVLNRLYIAYVYFVKVQVIVSDDYNCLIIFIVLMPINIITAGLFNMIIYVKLQSTFIIIMQETCIYNTYQIVTYINIQ